MTVNRFKKVHYFLKETKFATCIFVWCAKITFINYILFTQIIYLDNTTAILSLFENWTNKINGNQNNFNGFDALKTA